MPKFKNEKQSFRHRGFQSSDPAADVVMIYGDGTEPVNADGSSMTKLWDHDVTETIQVVDHVPVNPAVI